METLSNDGSIGHSKQAGAFMNEDQIEMLIKNLEAKKQDLNGEQDENPDANINWDLINNLPHNKLVDENF